MNRYQYAGGFGVILVAMGAGLLALSYPPTLVFGVQATLFVVAGVFHVLSAVPTSLRTYVGPHRLLGLGNIALGASLAVSGLNEYGTDGEFVYVVAIALSGASLALIGLAYIFRPGDFGLGPDGFPE